ncbi:helix-turn-helix domain-containing protein [Streptomyces sp. NPDC035033]|uniref:helix-turn-helix domain-containing protein n=1 Tax=Streptomyces sp. NPDC035033 TaxID=3155368 RepID=UPI0033C4BC54
MITEWGTDGYDLSDRADALRQTVRDQLVPVELELPDAPEDVHAHVAIHQFACLQLSRVVANPATVRRTPRLARADWEPHLFVSLQVTGESMVVQDGRYAVLRPGQMGVYDTTKPYTLVFDQGVDMRFLRVPLSEIALPYRLVEQTLARPLGGTGTVAGLASAFFARLADSPGLAQRPGGHALESAGLEMLRATLAEAVHQHAASRAPLERALFLRLMDYMRRHVASPDLTPERVARAHHISRRQLYNVLGRNDVAFGEWVRSRRLAEARRTLVAEPGLRVADVAGTWGFASAAHFSRAFKEAYGLTPSDWRAAHQEPVHPSTGH